MQNSKNNSLGYLPSNAALYNILELILPYQMTDIRFMPIYNIDASINYAISLIQTCDNKIMYNKIMYNKIMYNKIKLPYSSFLFYIFIIYNRLSVYIINFIMQ